MIVHKSKLIDSSSFIMFMKLLRELSEFDTYAQNGIWKAGKYLESRNERVYLIFKILGCILVVVLLLFGGTVSATMRLCTLTWKV